MTTGTACIPDIVDAPSSLILALGTFVVPLVVVEGGC